MCPGLWPKAPVAAIPGATLAPGSTKLAFSASGPNGVFALVAPPSGAEPPNQKSCSTAPVT